MDSARAAGVGFVTGAVYAFVKQLGGVQAVNGTTKVAPKPPFH